MSEQIQKQRVKSRRVQEEIQELPEPIDETLIKALADLTLEHIDEVIE